MQASPVLLTTPGVSGCHNVSEGRQCHAPTSGDGNSTCAGGPTAVPFVSRSKERSEGPLCHLDTQFWDSEPGRESPGAGAKMDASCHPQSCKSFWKVKAVIWRSASEWRCCFWLLLNRRWETDPEIMNKHWLMGAAHC